MKVRQVSGESIRIWVSSVFFVFFSLSLLIPKAEAYDPFSLMDLSGTESGLKIQVFPEKKQIQQNEAFRFYVVANLDEGWHLYSLDSIKSPVDTHSTEISLDTNAFNAVSPWEESKPQIVADKILNKIVKVHSQRAEFSRLLRVPGDARVGSYLLTGTFRFRTCNNKVCTLPHTLTFASLVKVVPGDSLKNDTP